jgi:hypothetical protein
MNDCELIRQEEAKRTHCWNPQARWKTLQAAIDWVDNQQQVKRNSPAGCIAATLKREQAANTN